MTRSSDILIIGEGVSSIFPILLGKKRVTVIEKGKPFSRILVSGNGRCNFFNEDILDKDNIFNKIILNEEEKNYPEEVLSYIQNELDISFYKEGKYYYPFFNKSECFYYPLLKKIEKSEAFFIRGEATFIDHQKKEVTYVNEGKKEKIKYNKLLLATGAFSYHNERNYQLLNSLQVKLIPFSPSLCPIRVKEKIPSYLPGLRIRGTVHVQIEGEELYQEEGEILFKNDGLSGIVIYNVSLFINSLPYKEKEIKILIDYSSFSGFKNTSKVALPENLLKYINSKNLKINEMLNFTFDSFYDFPFSQTSYGGISLDEIDLSSFMLKRREDIFVAGETINLNFPCGGYNIGYNMIEGYKIIKRML